MEVAEAASTSFVNIPSASVGPGRAGLDRGPAFPPAEWRRYP